VGRREPAQRLRSWSLRLALGAALAAGALVIGASAASAHAQLESTVPSQSEVLLLPPRQVVLHFGEPVEIDFGSIRVFGPAGQRVDQGGTHHPGGDSHAVAIALPGGLPDGTYVVSWRVISADSHPVHGAFLFSVGNAAHAGRAQALSHALAAASGGLAVGIVYGVIRFAVLGALLVLVGLGVSLLMVWRGARRVPRIRRLVWGAWVVLVAGSVAGIAVQGVYAATLPLTHLFSLSLFDAVLRTRFGHVELLRLALLVLTVPVLRRFVHPADTDVAPAAWSVGAAAVLGAGLLLTPGLAGHASTSGNPVVGESLDFVHLAGASVWVGGLVLLGALFVPGIPDAERPPSLRAIAATFSPYAVGGLVAVVASGTVQTLREVGSFFALFHTVYGRTLVVKIALVAGLVALGAVSRRLAVGRWTWARPRRARVEGAAADPEQAPPRGLRRSALAECSVVVAVLVSTALLVNDAPARQAAAQPFSQSFTVLGLQVNTIVDPARVGAGNQVHVYLLGRVGQPVAVPELDAAVSLSSSGIGPISLPMTLVGPGHYRASNVVFPLAGQWTVKVTVRTSAIDEKEVFATVPVH